MSSTEAVRVTIFNQTYSLVATSNRREVEELARTVDELMRDIARGGSHDVTRTAVLACLHLADQLRLAQQELDGLRRDINRKADRLSTLLDTVL